MESIALAAELASVRLARQFVSSGLVERHLDPSVATLLTSELVGNVVRHARTEFTIAMRYNPCIRIEVHDGVAATDAFRDILARAPVEVPPQSPGGRGLGLVRALASRFGLGDEPGAWNGKVVWFELDHADLDANQPVGG